MPPSCSRWRTSLDVGAADRRERPPRPRPTLISFSPNQRNATFHDATLNTTLTILHAGGLNLSDHGGTRTVLDPKFAPELHRLGVHPSAQSGGRRADVLFAGTTFHDDTSLGERTCSTTGCACNRSWAELEVAHKHDKRRYARYLTAIQRRGTQVVYMSIFPRCKDHCGAPDFLRAFADDVAHHELHAAGFYEAGGRFVDQWPLAAAYWDVKQRGKSQYGPSSLHYATTSVGDRYVLPDFVGMREQFALNALCSDAPAAHQPCGPPGRNHFTPQARTVYESGANCSCGPWGLSIPADPVTPTPTRPRRSGESERDREGGCRGARFARAGSAARLNTSRVSLVLEDVC